MLPMVLASSAVKRAMSPEFALQRSVAHSGDHLVQPGGSTPEGVQHPFPATCHGDVVPNGNAVAAGVEVSPSTKEAGNEWSTGEDLGVAAQQ